MKEKLEARNEVGETQQTREGQSEPTAIQKKNAGKDVDKLIDFIGGEEKTKVRKQDKVLKEKKQQNQEVKKQNDSMLFLLRITECV